jgi:hypothetical protein
VNVFYKIIWKYIKVVSSLCFAMCRDICDYPMITQLDAKVCVILVSWRPICVTVIEFLLCDGDNELCMCDDNIEFHLYDGV